MRLLSRPARLSILGIAAAAVVLLAAFRGRAPEPGASQVMHGEPPAVPPGQGPLPKLKAPRVLVEKARRRLTVYEGDAAVKSYRVALGRGEGDKLREGDGRTPEGLFYICHHHPQSKYHLSLGLSYPNAEDAQRGLKDGLISTQEHDLIVDAIKRGKTPLQCAVGDGTSEAQMAQNHVETEAGGADRKRKPLLGSF